MARPSNYLSALEDDMVMPVLISIAVNKNVHITASKVMLSGSWRVGSYLFLFTAL